MNAVEIEAAVSELAAAPYDAAEFPFQFLAAFDKKETTLKRLRKGDTNKSDVFGAVLLINNIHLAICPAGQTRETLELLKASPKTAAARSKFIFATDGSYFEAEDVIGARDAELKQSTAALEATIVQVRQLPAMLGQQTSKYIAAGIREVVQEDFRQPIEKAVEGPIRSIEVAAPCAGGGRAC